MLSTPFACAASQVQQLLAGLCTTALRHCLSVLLSLRHLCLIPVFRCCCHLRGGCVQEDPHDDYSHLLQDLSGGEGLQESTELIWGSSDELAAPHQAGSSSSDSVLQAESPMVSKVGPACARQHRMEAAKHAKVNNQEGASKGTSVLGAAAAMSGSVHCT